jgi:tRNA nucleotidyltransferase (CCA-adding enzyme)
MVGYDQRNPHHCYDLFTHTLHTVAGIKETVPVLLRVAAFFHDIGKPLVAMEKQGRLVFYGHAQKSAEMASPILRKMGYNEDEIKEVCFYIKHHDDFISWVLPEEDYNHENKYFVPITKENMQRHISRVLKKIGADDFQPNLQNWKNLLDLCYADASAQAEVVVQNGTIIDTKVHKLSKIKALQNCLE